MSNRSEVEIKESYLVMRGLVSRGLSFYGPFPTFTEAVAYGNKNFPDDTREITIMFKETVTRG